LILHNGSVVRLRSFIALFVIVGFLISLHGRVEAESSSHSHSDAFEAAHHKDRDDPVPVGKASPWGAHTDQHGCYHSHAPFNVPATVSLAPISCSSYVIETIQLFFPKITFVITHPPRA
jgi:hypothetical protein